MRIDKSQLKVGQFITLDAGVPAVVHKRAPPKFGDPPPKPQSPDFSEIQARLDDAQKRLEEIRAMVRRRKR